MGSSSGFLSEFLDLLNFGIFFFVREFFEDCRNIFFVIFGGSLEMFEKVLVQVWRIFFEDFR